MFLSFALIFLSAVEDLTWTLEGMFWRLAGIKDYFKIIDTPIEVQDKV
jgi:ABC-type multidrug transport system fused ATPase/permease subunit